MQIETLTQKLKIKKINSNIKSYFGHNESTHRGGFGELGQVPDSSTQQAELVPFINTVWSGIFLFYFLSSIFPL